MVDVVVLLKFSGLLALKMAVVLLVAHWYGRDTRDD